MVTTRRGLVDEPRHEPVPTIFEEAGVFIQPQAQRALLEHLGELIELYRSLRCEPALEQVTPARAHDVTHRCGVGDVVAEEGREPGGKRCIAQAAVLPEIRVAPIPDRHLGDVLVRREQVMEHRLVRAVEHAA